VWSFVVCSLSCFCFSQLAFAQDIKAGDRVAWVVDGAVYKRGVVQSVPRKDYYTIQFDDDTPGLSGTTIISKPGSEIVSEAAVKSTENQSLVPPTSASGTNSNSSQIAGRIPSSISPATARRNMPSGLAETTGKVGGIASCNCVPNPHINSSGWPANADTFSKVIKAKYEVEEGSFQYKQGCTIDRIQVGSPYTWKPTDTQFLAAANVQAYPVTVDFTTCKDGKGQVTVSTGKNYRFTLYRNPARNNEWDASLMQQGSYTLKDLAK
jgi:hypothetical protein